MGQVIEFKNIQKQATQKDATSEKTTEKSSKKTKKANATAAASESMPVISITEERKKIVTEERRIVKRSILSEFVALHAVIPGFGLMKVVLYDITTQGLSFDLEKPQGQFNEGEIVNLRIYLNHQTYFPFDVKVKHTSPILDEEVTRHGCEFIKSSVNDVALQYFAKFLENVSAGLRRDHGDVLVSLRQS